METSELTPDYHAFGDKGDIWNDRVHIAKNGRNPNTLCGKPMLATNWARLEEHKKIGCDQCLLIYSQQLKTNKT